MHFDLDDFGDGFGSHQYARESAALNQCDSHQWNCAWADGGDCTCGVCPPEEDAPSDAEMIAAGYKRGANGVWTAGCPDLAPPPSPDFCVGARVVQRRLGPVYGVITHVLEDGGYVWRADNGGVRTYRPENHNQVPLELDRDAKDDCPF